MSDIQLTEEEQVQAVKKWFKENGTSILVGVLLGVGGIIGYWQWNEHKKNQSYDAAAKYQEFVTAVQSNKEDAIKISAATLQKDFSSTPYANLAAITMAKRSLDVGDVASAEAHLRNAMEQSSHDMLKHLARTRLVNILINQNKTDDALKLIADQNDPAYLADYAELRGDIFKIQGKLDQAREAYQQALNESSVQGQRRQFIEMKKDDLSVATASNPNNQISTTGQN